MPIIIIIFIILLIRITTVASASLSSCEGMLQLLQQELRHNAVAKVPSAYRYSYSNIHQYESYIARQRNLDVYL